MSGYHVFAQIRAERAAREMRGVVLPFQPPVQNEIAAENSLAATWTELWSQLVDFWGDVCLDTLDMAHHAALAALDGYIIDAHQARIVCDRMEIVTQAQERRRQAVRQAEAEHTGRLIREIFEEA